MISKCPLFLNEMEEKKPQEIHDENIHNYYKSLDEHYFFYLSAMKNNNGKKNIYL